jgi:transcriptional regulator with XRE-family HTH domain
MSNTVDITETRWYKDVMSTMTSGKIIRLRRKYLKPCYTQKEFAKLIGISVKRLSNIELDRAKGITVDEYETIARLLHIDEQSLRDGFERIKRA